ncbi:MAG: hypothetical protein S0880_09640 [Actinomycetota bacterium]|nr:hypothetical protein [Actinomycetota bacterium]
MALAVGGVLDLRSAADHVADLDRRLVDEWRRAVRDQLDELRRMLDLHSDEVERPEGLFSQLIEDDPRLGARLDRLRRDRRRLRGELGELHRTFEDQALVVRPVALAELRDRLRAIVSASKVYHDRVSAVTWDAYELDLGGPG